MFWLILLSGLSLVLIVEGLMPFLVPGVWKRMLSKVIQQPDASLRVFGLICLILGAVLMFVVHSGWISFG
jgi:uncharacterized protein